MKMIQKWGYMIVLFFIILNAQAEHPNDKSARACYRASNHEALLFDNSYFSSLQLIGSMEDIQKYLEPFLDPLGPSVVGSRYAPGHRQGSTLFYEPLQYPRGCIGPISFFWKQTADAKRTLWIWIHPCIFPTVMNHLQAIQSESVQLHSLEREFCRFEMTGPRSHAILQTVFDLSTDDEPEKPVYVNASAHNVSFGFKH